ncbi:hypothetical protein BD413DRAFT_584075 [Trametes elegans]|nr:hypothetical protein BD413DRAFT_584075 [Trametes elegans]
MKVTNHPKVVFKDQHYHRVSHNLARFRTQGQGQTSGSKGIEMCFYRSAREEGPPNQSLKYATSQPVCGGRS